MFKLSRVLEGRPTYQTILLSVSSPYTMSNVDVKIILPMFTRRSTSLHPVVPDPVPTPAPVAVHVLEDRATSVPRRGRVSQLIQVVGPSGVRSDNVINRSQSDSSVHTTLVTVH